MVRYEINVASNTWHGDLLYDSYQMLLFMPSILIRYGQILPPGLDAESFVEEEYHGT